MAINKIDSGSLLNITQNTTSNKKANIFESMVNQQVSKLAQNSKTLTTSNTSSNLQSKPFAQNSNIQSK
uniref:Uncharacterized protein n=1 Tax=Thermodesulfobium narugense TaxID=184064 RepID=A0A7C5KCZ6_9BACT